MEVRSLQVCEGIREHGGICEGPKEEMLSKDSPGDLGRWIGEA